eukprot:TRINITY_DN2404_c0_g1_i1.p1 TRINITY_DN2404_c0_g1~~TRINITY_DN2404_c0_g1_i1.p1  ORF type:complete len:215 (-),score=70.24 TRINITY_DN2404_c0_g1_i1:137-781(-)
MSGWLFKKPPTPKELARKWQLQLRRDMRALDREIRAIQQEENKVKKSIKEAAKKGQMSSAKLLAKELARSGKAVERLHKNKAQLNSVSMQISSTMATATIAKNIGKSAEIMKMMNGLMSVPALSQSMREMSKEMEKAGLIEEMTDDMFEDLEDDDISEEADEEIDKVLTSILGEAGAVGSGKLDSGKQAEESKDTAKEEAELDAMRSRLQALNQ